MRIRGRGRGHGAVEAMARLLLLRASLCTCRVRAAKVVGASGRGPRRALRSARRGQPAARAGGCKVASVLGRKSGRRPQGRS